MNSSKSKRLKSIFLLLLSFPHNIFAQQQEAVQQQPIQQQNYIKPSPRWANGKYFLSFEV